MVLRKIILHFLLCFPCTVIFGQTSLIDSLEHELTICRQDDAKTDLLTSLSFEYRDIDPPKCKEYAEQALELSQKIDDKRREAAAYNALGVYYYYADMPYPAYVNYKKAEKLFLEYGTWNDPKEIYYNLTHLYIFIRDKENAEYYADKLLDIAIKEGDPAGEVDARFTVGAARFSEISGKEALEYYSDLYEKALPLNNTTTYVVSLFCGETHIQMKQYKEGLKYLHRARRYFEKHKEPGFTMEAYIRLADAYTAMHRVDSAEYWLWKVSKSPTVYESVKIRMLYDRSVLDSINGDYWGALSNFKDYHRITDSLAKAGNTSEMARMRNRFEIEQKETENRMLLHEQEAQQRLICFLTGALCLILVLILLLAYYYWRSVKKNSELKELHGIKDKLFSLVAHDLRGPIGTLMTMLKLVNQGGLDTATQNELLKGISNRVDDTYGLLDNLLCWSKTQMQSIVPSPAHFDLQLASMVTVRSLQGIALEKRITLSNRIESRKVYADKDIFTVVVRNLTMNALKYTFEGGKVTLASKPAGDMLIISVQDNGTGMTRDVQNKLFKLAETKSKRGTNNESGTGLGLVLCADFVKMNGGSIWFESEESKGTTFFFTIPCRPKE